MLVVILIAFACWLMFVWGDAWGREAKDRDQVQRAIIAYKAQVEAEKTRLANNFTPSPIILFILLLLLGLAFCGGHGDAFYDAGRHR